MKFLLLGSPVAISMLINFIELGILKGFGLFLL